MRRTSLVISDLGSGGAQRVLINLARLWLQQNLSVTVITFAGPESDFMVLPVKAARLNVGGYGPSNSLWESLVGNVGRVRRLRKAIRDSRPDVVVSFLAATNILTIFATFGLNCRVVICERNDPKRQSLGRLWDFLRWLFYRFADVTTANSRDAIESLKRYVPAARLEYVPNPVIAPEGVVAKNLPFPVILSVCRLSHQKAVDCVLRGFARVIESFPDWRLLVAGTGEDAADLKQLSARLGIESRVVWLGEVEDPWAYYAAAEVFVLASRYEGTPNALLEAMVSGVAPVVSDAILGADGLVLHNRSGLVFPVDEDRSLADALAQLMADEEKRKTIGRAARESVRRYLEDDAMLAWNRVIGHVPS
ncbi:MAG: glycosyltransferase [Alphaproteobacteria bacterium]